MPNRNDRDSDKPRHMPETAEVGSEGGSYADATVQEATDTGDLPRVKRATVSIIATARWPTPCPRLPTRRKTASGPLTTHS
jgi:hypothetical protein